MNDNRLEALEQAEFYWKKAFYADKLTKLAYAEDLHKYGMFSLSQIAKVVRMRTVEVTRHGLKPNSRGGRFEPETLSCLITMRKRHLKNQKVTPDLIVLCTSGGTSLSCAAILTGVSYSNHYKMVPERSVEELRKLRLKPTEREAIVKAMRANADPALLAQQYDISVDTVWEIAKTYENI